MPTVSSRSSERWTPVMERVGGSSSIAMRGTTLPVGRTRKYVGRGL